MQFRPDFKLPPHLYHYRKAQVNEYTILLFICNSDGINCFQCKLNKPWKCQTPTVIVTVNWTGHHTWKMWPQLSMKERNEKTKYGLQYVWPCIKWYHHIHIDSWSTNSSLPIAISALCLQVIHSYIYTICKGSSSLNKHVLFIYFRFQYTALLYHVLISNIRTTILPSFRILMNFLH